MNKVLLVLLCIFTVNIYAAPSVTFRTGYSTVIIDGEPLADTDGTPVKYFQQDTAKAAAVVASFACGNSCQVQVRPGAIFVNTSLDVSPYRPTLVSVVGKAVSWVNPATRRDGSELKPGAIDGVQVQYWQVVGEEKIVNISFSTDTTQLFNISAGLWSVRVRVKDLDGNVGLWSYTATKTID